MSDPIKRIDIKEFKDVGYLQEVNRKFFHPLGLALEVLIDEEGGDSKITGIWDYRDDPEGICFGDSYLDPDKAERVAAEWDEKERSRYKLLGYIIQPIPTNDR